MSEEKITVYVCDICGCRDFEAKEVRFIAKHRNDLVAHICFNPDCFTKLMEKECFYTKTIGIEAQFALRSHEMKK